MNFRHLLEKHKLSSQLFKEVNRCLSYAGIYLKEGTIVDATWYEPTIKRIDRGLIFVSLFDVWLARFGVWGNGCTHTCKNKIASELRHCT